MTNKSRITTKPTKWHVCPAKTQISLGICPVWSESSLSAWKKTWVLSYPLKAQRRLWSDWADAQADLSLCWAHSHFVGFVMRRLKWFWLLTLLSLISQIRMQWQMPRLIWVFAGRSCYFVGFVVRRLISRLCLWVDVSSNFHNITCKPTNNEF